jgi:septal ring factor EnvC (AmiA/AmiB activator)
VGYIGIEFESVMSAARCKPGMESGRPVSYMENKVIDMLLEIKSDISEIKKGQIDLKDGVNRLEGRMYKVEDDVSDIRGDVAEIKTTVNAMSDALLTTSKEVKQLKGKK